MGAVLIHALYLINLGGDRADFYEKSADDVARDREDRNRDRRRRRRFPRRLPSRLRLRSDARPDCRRARAGARRVRRQDLAPDREHRGSWRNDRPLGRRARSYRRSARAPPTSRPLPRLVPPVRVRIRHHRSGSTRSPARRGRRQDRARPVARTPHQRLEGTPRIEPRPARQRSRRIDGRTARCLPCPSTAAGAPRRARDAGAGRPRRRSRRRRRAPRPPRALERTRLAGLYVSRAWASTRNAGAPSGSSKNSGFTQPSSFSRRV